tara:strand:- start:425 stop:757 length:333 start_codon:yes stop_codon:yes gene_type:complete
MSANFQATTNKGFRMTFDNGFAISVQWGSMNYCERRNYSDEYKSELKEDFIKSSDAEIAVIDKDGEMLNLTEHDQVIGWLSPNKVSKVIGIVSSSTTKNEIETKIKSLNL